MDLRLYVVKDVYIYIYKPGYRLPRAQRVVECPRAPVFVCTGIYISTYRPLE
jgi:hypothetical protein